MPDPLAAPAALNQVAARLSLRAPQRAALVRLAEIVDQIELARDTDLAAVAEIVHAVAPSFEAFERDFPSLCFALATGVGKTRLMGAFITWLYLTGRSRNFFVLAPNTTIYEKLIADFTPGTPKYVFTGIAEFAHEPPLIVTGDNYANGAGLRRSGSLFDADVIVNIFNVDKINSDKGRIRRLQEYLGTSYFEYLSNLPDLVLLMDEAHRYRAAAGMNAIAELKPILGLELTATPKTIGAKPRAFCNVVYKYGLAEAMADGFVKQPAVATRSDFRPEDHNEDELERIKLDDAVTHHDYVAVELARYARVTGGRLVHPFILVVAANTSHASRLKTYLESDAFQNGRFRGRVIEVHSKTSGVESDEAAAKLVHLEHDAAVDIVIHVNKLKEGWDVTNLYTIVPLRTSASDILTEQTLGRGLRLPFGKRTDVAAIDRLTVIAHDRFDAIIQAAREPGSIVMRAITIGEGGEVPREQPMLVEAPSVAEMQLTGQVPKIAQGLVAPSPVLVSESARAVARQALVLVRERAVRLSSTELASDPVQAALAAELETQLAAAGQDALFKVADAPSAREIVTQTIETLIGNTIEVPDISVTPIEEQTFGFRDFDLIGLETITLRPTGQDLLLHEFGTDARVQVRRERKRSGEALLERYLVDELVEYDDVDYEANVALLFKLARQVVARMQEYLGAREVIEHALIEHAPRLAAFIHAQMLDQLWVAPTDYEVRVSSRLRLLEPLTLTAVGSARSFKTPVTPKSETRRHVFAGFASCCSVLQQFDSDDERELACLLERDPQVVRWLKPGPRQLRIEYDAGRAYEPDFVVETANAKLLIEVKAHNEMNDPIVLAKASAASVWCGHATEHRGAGKPWSYLLVPENAITENATLAGLAAQFTR